MAKNLSSFPKVYLDIMHDMMSHGTSPNAQTTIEGLKNLYFQRKKIAAFDNESERNAEIVKVCHLEVDRNFCQGKTPDERMNEINDKLQLLIDAYEDAKKNGYVDHFFLSAFESDSHLNHRLEHLSAFYNQHKGKKFAQKV
jgi:hypothetical protein